MAEVRIELAELPAKLAGKGKTAAELAGTEPAASAGGAGAAETRADAAAVLSGAQRELIAEAVRAEIRPLRREIIAYLIWSTQRSCAGASSGIIRNSSRRSGSDISKAAAGGASIITPRCASQLTDS